MPITLLRGPASRSSSATLFTSILQGTHLFPHAAGTTGRTLVSAAQYIRAPVFPFHPIVGNNAMNGRYAAGIDTGMTGRRYGRRIGIIAFSALNPSRSNRLNPFAP